jgi:hypothetical protein
VWTAPNIAFYMRYETVPLFSSLLIAGRDDFVHAYALLTRIAMASVVSCALWNEALQRHLGSGNPKPERVHTLRGLVYANAYAVLWQSIGAIGLSFANVRISEIRQGIFLVRLHFLRVPSLTWTALFARTSSSVDRYLHGKTRASKRSSRLGVRLVPGIVNGASYTADQPDQPTSHSKLTGGEGYVESSMPTTHSHDILGSHSVAFQGRTGIYHRTYFSTISSTIAS